MPVLLPRGGLVGGAIGGETEKKSVSTPAGDKQAEEAYPMESHVYSHTGEGRADQQAYGYKIQRRDSGEDSGMEK